MKKLLITGFDPFGGALRNPSWEAVRMLPERIAVNIRDARVPDNRGFQPQGQRIAPEDPAAYFATVPVEVMAQAIRAAGVPGAVSNTADTYVCNDVFYTLLHRYSGTAVRVGFIHVPPPNRGPQAALRSKSPPL